MKNKKQIIIISAVIALLIVGGVTAYLIYPDSSDFSNDKASETADDKTNKIIEYADDDKNKDEAHMQTVPAGEGEEYTPVTESPIPEGLSGPSNYAETTNLQ